MIPETLHADAVARWTPAGWRGVLITGASGAGKSDLALKLIGRGWRLVSDDYSHVWASGGALWATAPERIAGLIEARGLGIVAMRTRLTARIGLVVECVEGTVERLPEPAVARIAGMDAPKLSLDPRHASAVELVAAAVSRL
ncbi:MAG: HPr kinase/phosphatase C-terminal domain-containing protein [Pseudomonadota bacterium]